MEPISVEVYISADNYASKRELNVTPINILSTSESLVIPLAFVYRWEDLTLDCVLTR